MTSLNARMGEISTQKVTFGKASQDQVLHLVLYNGNYNGWASCR